MTVQMLTPGMGDWGLGVQIGGSKTDPYFTHGGVNEGFESLFTAYEKGGEGAVVMTNVQGGEELCQEVMRSIAAEYGWPDLKPEVRTAVAVDVKVLAEYVGAYSVRPGFDVVLTVKDGHLVATATGQNPEDVIAESATKFLVPGVGAEFGFEPDAEGKVTYLVLNPGGRSMKAMKK